jgi:prevent-host-death family protein
MHKMSVCEAKARFSGVVKRAQEGRQMVITRRGKPVARVVPEKAARSERWDRSEAVDRIVELSKTSRPVRENGSTLAFAGRCAGSPLNRHGKVAGRAWMTVPDEAGKL